MAFQFNHRKNIGDIANGIVTDAEYAQSCALRFIMYDQDQYYETNNAMKESGALRVSRAREMIAELIQVIAAAKDFSCTTEAFFSGKPRLEKSSVERVWLVQEARSAANRFRISAQKYQPASDSEEQDEYEAQVILFRER